LAADAVDPAGQSICPFLIMCIVSMPAIRIRALQNDLNPSIGWVTRFDGPVGPVRRMLFRLLVLSHQDAETGVGLDTFNGGRIGTALVDGDLLGHAVQVDGSFQKTPGRSLIALGSQ